MEGASEKHLEAHGGGFIDEESRRSHGGGRLEEECRRRHLGRIWEAPGAGGIGKAADSSQWLGRGIPSGWRV